MLKTKLYRPKTKTKLVYRQELSKKLDKAHDKKLVLISAPAGYGKTSLVSQWIDRNKHTYSWYTIDQSDNDPSIFLSYLIAGLQTIKQDFGARGLKLLNSPGKTGIEAITALMINDMLSFEKEIYIILDDFHLISSNEIIETVRYLLNHIPENVHLFILTRSDPFLPTSRLRSQNQLLEIRISDLSFSLNEIADFFNKKLKLGLNKRDIYSLETKTEGWIAGLQLAALSMQGISDKSEFIAKLAGSNRYIMDYLMEEVLSKKPIEIQTFLLKSSFLKQLSAPLCNVVLNRNDSQLILEQMDRDNMFLLPLDTERKWYRYHHLFADLLKQRFLLQDKNLLDDLNKKAAKWYEENKLYDLAIEHALAVKDYKWSIEIISKVVEALWNQGKHAAILNYGDALPDAIIKSNPHFCLYYSWILIANGEVKKAAPFLASAEHEIKKHISITGKVLGKSPFRDQDAQHYKKLYGKIAVAFAYLYSHEEHSEQMLAYCKIGLDSLTEHDSLWYSWAWFTYGLAHYCEGKLQESKDAFNTAFNYAQRTDNIYLMSTILGRLAENEQQLGMYKSAYKRCTSLLAYISELGYYEVSKMEWTYAPLYLIMGVTELGWAEFDKAYEHIKTAYELSKKGNDNFYQIYVSIIYSVILNYHGEREGAQIARELDDLVSQREVPSFLTSFYITSKVYWLMEMNQIEQANNFVAGYGLDINKEIDKAYDMAYVAYVRLLIRQYKIDDADSLLTELYSFAQSNNEIDRLVELNILYTELYELQGQRERAIDSLTKALELASPEDQLFNFVFWADKLKSVLKDVYKIQATSITNIPKGFIKKLQLTIKNEEKRKKRKAQSDLSVREVETLVLLAEDISNQEIANKLFISLNTVKTRLKNIFLKLEVDNRRKAVAKAREQGLI
jgi:LuxR family maltose regulon positive regulatory protein